MDVRHYLPLILGLAIVVLKSDTASAPPAFESPSVPRISISNGVIQAVVLLPDPETGYYRGPRFDWSGLVAQVKCQGHTYFGEWKTPHDPEGNDDVVGPAEEFGMGGTGISGPLGYAEAKPGGAFIKIGVGLLERIEEPEYRFSYNYRIVKPGNWRIRSGKSWVEFRQELGIESGWGYSYTKRVSLTANRPELVITHLLRNTGSKPLVTTHYCHNFSVIDNEPIGPSYSVRFPFAVTAKQDLGKLAEVHGNTLTFTRTLNQGDYVYGELGGFTSSASDNGATVENLKTGAGVRIKGDKPVLQFHFFAVRSAACPEPFVQIQLAPEEHEEWETTYTFFQLGAGKR
jgi:hypothetical protein